MTIKIKNQRDPKVWRPRVKPVTVPSRWPKGQSVLDRLYWLDVSLIRAEPFTPEYRRLNGLYAQALGIL